MSGVCGPPSTLNVHSLSNVRVQFFEFAYLWGFRKVHEADTHLRPGTMKPHQHAGLSLSFRKLRASRRGKIQQGGPYHLSALPVEDRAGTQVSQ